MLLIGGERRGATVVSSGTCCRASTAGAAVTFTRLKTSLQIPLTLIRITLALAFIAKGMDVGGGDSRGGWSSITAYVGLVVV